MTVVAKVWYSRDTIEATLPRWHTIYGEGKVQSVAKRSYTIRKPFVSAGAVTGIGSLPLTSVSSAIQAVAQFSPQVPFWPQLRNSRYPRVPSGKDSVVSLDSLSRARKATATRSNPDVSIRFSKPCTAAAERLHRQTRQALARSRTR